ncbi:unnamed protein product [Polarella glacialis]|uniref:Protein-serine/threonine phosphatase n=1 Tax=Polarella glacialis TaxID=89957 RepID=A0A813KGH0_POLGL|nr:unnamed protein product [Polarella glacialis]
MSCLDSALGEACVDLQAISLLLGPSLKAARQAGAGAGQSEGAVSLDGQSVKAQQWLPFEKQTPVSEGEQIFHICDLVFVGSEFGAANRDLLDGLGIRAVINVTAGSGRVPNHFESSGDFEYLHFELFDQPGSDPSEAARGSCEALSRWGQEGRRTLVHCSAGLSRSVTLVLAWLMESKGLSLLDAVELVNEQRGRRVQCNPSFWCFLAALERRQKGWPPGTTPSFDFTRWVVEDLEKMGFDAALVRQALHDRADWVHFETLMDSVLEGCPGSVLEKLFGEAPGLVYEARQISEWRQMLTATAAPNVSQTLFLKAEVRRADLPAVWRVFEAEGVRALEIGATRADMRGHFAVAAGTSACQSIVFHVGNECVLDADVASLPWSLHCIWEVVQVPFKVPVLVPLPLPFSTLWPNHDPFTALQSGNFLLEEEEAGFKNRRAPPYQLTYAPEPTADAVLLSGARDTQVGGLVLQWSNIYSRRVIESPLPGAKLGMLSPPNSGFASSVRQEGSNGDREMAASFHMAGFEAWDVHMSDLLEGRLFPSGAVVKIAINISHTDICANIFTCSSTTVREANCDPLSLSPSVALPLSVASATPTLWTPPKGRIPSDDRSASAFQKGGTSDQLQWAGSVLFSPKLAAQFKAFRSRPDTFALGICNGQPHRRHLLLEMAAVPLPLVEQPRFVHNRSSRFESRFVTVRIEKSAATKVWLRGMEGSRQGSEGCDFQSLLQTLIRGSAGPNMPGTDQCHFPTKAVYERVKKPGAHFATISTARFNIKEIQNQLIPMRYVDDDGQPTEKCEDGRQMAIMPHPERLTAWCGPKGRKRCATKECECSWLAQAMAVAVHPRGLDRGPLAAESVAMAAGPFYFSFFLLGVCALIMLRQSIAIIPALAETRLACLILDALRHRVATPVNKAQTLPERSQPLPGPHLDRMTFSSADFLGRISEAPMHKFMDRNLVVTAQIRASHSRLIYGLLQHLTYNFMHVPLDCTVGSCLAQEVGIHELGHVSAGGPVPQTKPQMGYGQAGGAEMTRPQMGNGQVAQTNPQLHHLSGHGLQANVQESRGFLDIVQGLFDVGSAEETSAVHNGAREDARLAEVVLECTYSTGVDVDTLPLKHKCLALRAGEAPWAVGRQQQPNLFARLVPDEATRTLISRSHVVLSWDGQTLRLKKLSPNNVQLNGRPVQMGEEVPVTDGSCMIFCGRDNASPILSFNILLRDSQSVSLHPTPLPTHPDMPIQQLLSVPATSASASIPPSNAGKADPQRLQRDACSPWASSSPATASADAKSSAAWWYSGPIGPYALQCEQA